MAPPVSANAWADYSAGAAPVNVHNYGMLRRIMKRQKYTKNDFAWVTWGTKDFNRISREILAHKKRAYAKVKAIPKGERTFENTVLALENAGAMPSDQLGRVSILKEASPSAPTRRAAAKMLEALSKKLVELEYDPALYAALKEYAARREKLSGPEKILFEDMLKGYARMGFDLPKSKQKILKANLKKLTELGLAFDRNLNEYKDHILVTEEELAGLPEPYKANLAREGSKYKVTLSYPDVHPFVAGAHNETKRRELLEKFVRRGGPQNVALMKKMVEIRKRDIKLLGYKNFLDYTTELRMAKSARNVAKFLHELERLTRRKVAEDRAMLTAYKRRITKNKKAQVESHDIGYLFKQLRKEKFSLDSDLLKEYFPFEHVKRATLGAYQELLGITFKQRKDIPLWHEEVQMFDVYDARRGEYLASFLLDLYPREGKYGHAAAFDVIYGREKNGMYRAPLCVMMANFPKPSKANPSLMSHGEVETFFHEFGHVMHFCLTRAKYRSQAGFNVAWDFVEAPSQMLENWCWDKGMLKKLSKHYKTGKSLPDDLIKKLLATRLFGEAWNVRGQIVLALYDYRLHTENRDPVKLYADLTTKLIGIAPPKRQLWVAGFGHLAHGYEGGYYSYLWSKVYADDMFTKFQKQGVLNQKVGREYRKWILEKGSSMEEMDLIKGFLGRKPNNKAFINSIGA